MTVSYEVPATGAEFRRLREEAGLSRVALARRTELDPSTIYNLEHDRLVARRTRLLVAAALGVAVFPPVEKASSP